LSAPGGFRVLEGQGPFLEHVGPIHVSDGGGELVFGLRHTNHRGREIVRARAVWVVAG